MPHIQASLDFLADIPLYDYEKPYLALLPPQEGFDPDSERTDNLEWETHSDITITDIRGNFNLYTIEECGFQVVHHASRDLDLQSTDSLNAYKKETEVLLNKELEAIHVVCYDLRLRRNVKFERDSFDINDPFLIEGPAKGAHNDVTFGSGPEMIARYLNAEHKSRFFKPGYRFRIVNTWRALLPVLEDRPLALCDFRSLDPDDLVEADRVLPNRVGEVYYLKYNQKQRWCWLEKQRPDEPFMFVMFDTKAGHHARYCPHVSFSNPRAPANAAPRRSVETRSIVISKA